MTIGTRSLLFGAHQLLIHTAFIAVAWWKLYGFPRDVRLWFAFLLHDVGYWGCTTMDGDDGSLHPERGGAIMGRLFGQPWRVFTCAHSRFYARLLEVSPSRLCAADKLATALEPWWLYLPRVRATGELAEYMADGPRLHPHAYPNGVILDARAWFSNMVAHNLRWVGDRAHSTELGNVPR